MYTTYIYIVIKYLSTCTCTCKHSLFHHELISQVQGIYISSLEHEAECFKLYYPKHKGYK